MQKTHWEKIDSKSTLIVFLLKTCLVFFPKPLMKFDLTFMRVFSSEQIIFEVASSLAPSAVNCYNFERFNRELSYIFLTENRIKMQVFLAHTVVSLSNRIPED